MPDTGEEVYLDWSFGPTPIICDYVPEVTPIEKKKEFRTEVSPMRSFGGEDKFHKAEGDKPYRWGPKDLMPGDKILMGKLGNMLGILAGGVSILKASPLSQIILTKFNDTVKVVSRNFELYSDFGRLRMLNKDGVTSFEMSGNDTREKSNAHNDSAWDYTAKLGGKNLLELVLGKGKFSWVVNRDGHSQISTAKSFSIDMNSPPEIKIFGNSVSAVDGHREEFITGNKQKVIKGTDTEKTGRKVYVNSGAHNEVITGTVDRHHRGVTKEFTQGTGITSISTTGRETIVAAGDYAIDIGNPLHLGIPAPALLAQAKTGDYKVDTFAGDFVFSALVKGNFEFNTLLGDATFSTIAGDVGMSTAAGNVDMSTLLGDVAMTTLVGNAELSTALGDVEVKSVVGGVNITALAGTITLQAGVSKITLGPAGIKIENAGVELVSELLDLVTQLSTTAAPGFGGPITTAPVFGVQLAKVTLLKGV
jgi:hypothetical protein